MSVGVLTTLWDLHLPRGGQQSVNLLLKAANGITPYDITGRAFEYVVRADPNDSGTPLVSITSSLSSAGVLTIDVPKAIVNLTILNPATAALTPGTYYHSFWMEPSQPTAFNWFIGKLFVDPASQP